jgi:hypothetical protein
VDIEAAGESEFEREDEGIPGEQGAEGGYVSPEDCLEGIGCSGEYEGLWVSPKPLKATTTASLETTD